MSFGDDRFWITFIGEIFNFVELRQQLEGLGHRFRTGTDTEVVLASFAQWGIDCQYRFNGMWAFALWDAAERTLWLSRDRFGEKPLFYARNGEDFFFASELKAFFSLSGFDVSPDLDVLAASLTSSFGIESQPRSLLRGVSRLEAGHCARVADGKVQVRRWWNTYDHLAPVPGTFAQQTERFRELFEEACRLRIRSDIPVVSCLSGGLDSTSIVCTIAKHRETWHSTTERRFAHGAQHAFIASFPGAPNDERAYAELAAAWAGAIPEHCSLDEDLAAENVVRVLWDCEEIFFNAPIAIWQTYRSLRAAGSFVSLDGHGSDELLAGYPQHVAAAIASSGGMLSPLRLRRLMSTLRDVYGDQSQWPVQSAVRLAMRSTPGLSRVVATWDRLASLARASQDLAVGRKQVGLLRRRQQLDPTPYPGAPTHDVFRSAVHDDFHITVLPTLLRLFDRASMAHGVEIRCPFLDHRLVTYAFALPDDAKVGGGWTKNILRESMRGVIPEPIRARRQKVGFASPMGTLLSGKLGAWVQACVEDPRFAAVDLWDAKAIRAFVRERSTSKSWDYHAAERIWPFINAFVWLDFASGRGRPDTREAAPDLHSGVATA
jgi:asparagine synthase (glutamine-hydrolysing)